MEVGGVHGRAGVGVSGLDFSDDNRFVQMSTKRYECDSQEEALILFSPAESI